MPRSNCGRVTPFRKPTISAASSDALCVGHVPALGIGLAAKLFAHGGGWMHLQAQPLAAVQPLDKDGEGLVRVISWAHDGFRISQQQFAQRFAAGDIHGLSFGPINDFPRLADWVI